MSVYIVYDLCARSLECTDRAHTISVCWFVELVKQHGEMDDMGEMCCM